MKRPTANLVRPSRRAFLKTFAVPGLTLGVRSNAASLPSANEPRRMTRERAGLCVHDLRRDAGANVRLTA